jgi:hypothetical protein
LRNTSREKIAGFELHIFHAGTFVPGERYVCYGNAIEHFHVHGGGKTQPPDLNLSVPN